MAGDGRAGVTKAELLASLSLAADLGLGQPMEHVLRQTLIALRLADAAGYDRATAETVYYASLLAWVGCTADSSELARLFGDDVEVRRATYDTDLSGLPLLTFMVRNAGAGASPLRRVALIAEVLGTKVVQQSFLMHCDAAGQMAVRLGLSEAVVRALGQLFERWDGKGTPDGLAGTDIDPAVRALHLADIVEVYDRMGGERAAVSVAQDRRGGMFDPDLVDCFTAGAPDMLCGLDDTTWDEVIARDPALGVELDDDELDDALRALGDYADLKSPWWTGHSRSVGDLAGDAGEVLGLPAAGRQELRRAGYVHDLGVIGVSNHIWDRRGPLPAADRERMRTHAYLCDRMLARCDGLSGPRRLAAMHHERQDGSGYPSGIAGEAIPLAARVLAAADVYRALREPRPHRGALDAPGAASTLQEEVRAGRLDGAAVDAVLQAAGHPARRRTSHPVGLTQREVEVLVLLAQGQRNKEIAASLGISAKTVSAHLERIYAKAGVQTRAAAALFAMRHSLCPLPGGDAAP